jgi:Ion channel
MSGRPSATAVRGIVGSAPSPFRERTRVARLRASHSYGLVLVLIVAAFLFALLLPDAAWAGSVLVLLQCAILVCALWTAGAAAVDSKPSITLVLFSVAAAVANVLPGGRIAYGSVSLVAGLLTAAIVVVVGRGVLDQGEVNLQSIRGAIAVYILLGLLFTFLYGAVAQLGSASFFAQGTDGTRAIRTYFSYVTLATLGYGDYSPAGTVGHALAVVEALVGQIYLVTVVALLVSRVGRLRSRA